MLDSLLKKLQTTYVLNIITFLFLFTFCFYANTFFNGLFWDDEQFIYENNAVKSFSLVDFFSQSLVTGSGQLSNYYRPLLFTSFSLDYQLFADSGFIYHFNSLMLHTGAGILLFFFLQKLFQNRLLAFLASLFWLIHPLQTEAVSYASGRGDPLSFFFVILSLYLSLFKTRKMMIFSLVAFLCALLSKELSITTPALIFLTHLIYQKNITKKTVLKSLKISAPFFLLAGFYFSLRLTVLNFANTLNFYNGENIYSSSLFVRLNTFFHLLPEYLKLLFFPKDLFMERDILIAIQTKPTILSVISFVLLLCSGIFSLLKINKYPVLTFGLGWFVITFLPTTGIIPINGIFYEHFLYYPSVGFFLILSYFLLALYKKLNLIGKEILIFCLIISFLLLGVRTFIRNNDWKDPITFYKQTLSFAPSARIYNNLGMSYAEEQNFKDAIVNYEKAISLTDFYPETHYNLANAYIETGDLKKAEKEYRKTLQINPQFYLSYINLYRIYQATNDEKGKEEILKAVRDISRQNPNFLPLLEQLESQD